MRSVVAAAAALTAVLAHSAAAQRPQTVFVAGPGKIAAFAQDRDLMAWVSTGGQSCNTVHIRSVTNPIGFVLPAQNVHNVTCRFVWSRLEPVELALAGNNALWSLPQDSPLSLDYVLAAGTDPADRPERRLLEAAHTARGVGQWLGGIAGDGDTRVYAVTTVDWSDEAGCLAGTSPCTLVVSGGGIYVVRGRQPVRVAGTRPAVELAVSDGVVAYVPTGGLAKYGRPRASADLPIQVVDVGSGQRIASIVPQGAPLAVALSAHVLATLERTSLGLRLAWYDRDSGRARGSIPVPRTTTPRLSATDRLIVFRVGRQLRSVSVTTHRTRLLATAAATPLDFSLEGSRLAWAENLRGISRIQALYVSGRG